MHMQLDKLTEKSREALQAANTLAENWTNPEIEPEHLAVALLEQAEGARGHLLPSQGGGHRRAPPAGRGRRPLPRKAGFLARDGPLPPRAGRLEPGRPLAPHPEDPPRGPEGGRSAPRRVPVHRALPPGDGS